MENAVQDIWSPYYLDIRPTTHTPLYSILLCFIMIELYYQDSFEAGKKHFVIGYVAECQRSSTVDYFFYRVTLNTSTSIAESSGIHWPVVVCLLLAWTLIWLSYIRGISSSGKVSRLCISLIIVSLKHYELVHANLGGVRHSHSALYCSSHLSCTWSDS